jgi:hypothetical protein
MAAFSCFYVYFYFLLFFTRGVWPLWREGSLVSVYIGRLCRLLFPTRLVLDAFTNDTTAVVYFLQIPLGLQKLDLSI